MPMQAAPLTCLGSAFSDACYAFPLSLMKFNLHWLSCVICINKWGKKRHPWVTTPLCQWLLQVYISRYRPGAL